MRCATTSGAAVQCRPLLYPRYHRTVLRTAEKAGSVAAVVVGSGLAILSWAMRTGDLSERVARDAEAAYTPRPVAVVTAAVEPGSFSERGGPLLDELQQGANDEKGLPEQARKLCLKIRKGQEPFHRLPRESASLLDAHRSAVRAALIATHSQKMDLPRGLGVLDADYWKRDSFGSVPLQYAVKAATFDLWRSMSRSRPVDATGKELGTSPVDWKAAINTCLDILAMGRLISDSKGFVGIGLADGYVAIPFVACAGALNGAPTEEKLRAKGQLLSIRDSLRSFDDALADETVFSELAYARAAFSAAELSRLPAEGQGLVRAHPSTLAVWQRSLALRPQRPLLRGRDSLLATAAHPPMERAQSLKRLGADAASSWNPLRREAGFDASQFYSRHRHTVAMLDALALGAFAGDFRARHGHWPSPSDISEGIAMKSSDLLETKVDDATFRITVRDGEREPLSVAFLPGP